MEHSRVGRVVSISGAHVIVLLESGNPALQIGSLVKMHTPTSVVFGMVSGLSIPIPARQPEDAEARIGEIEIVGEVMTAPGSSGRFQRGMSVSPGLGDEVLTASKEDLSLVYARPAETTVRIGTIQQDRSIAAHVMVDDLLGKHFAIVGTTGSGKSCAVTLILRGIVAHHPNAHVVVLDPHGEYGQAFEGIAEVTDPENLQLPYWLLTYEEMVEVVFGAESREMPAEVQLLREMIQIAKLRFAGENGGAEMITVDTPVPYKMGDLTRILEDAAGKLENRNDLAPFLRLKSRLAALQSDRRFAFMFPSTVVVRDNMASIVARIFRIPVNGKPISILNLSAVPGEVLNVVVSVLCRMTFDVAQWSDQALPILLVCEEAHRYAPQSTSAGFEPAKRALSRIAREGRKYAVSLCVISQRPSELAASILSQCNTMFALRLTNEKDQEFLRGALSEATSTLLDSLPSLGNAEAIAVGEGVSVPMRLVFDRLPDDQRPASKTGRFSAAWQEDKASPAYLTAIIDRWRRQRR